MGGRKGVHDVLSGGRAFSNSATSWNWSADVEPRLERKQILDNLIPEHRWALQYICAWDRTPFYIRLAYV